MKITSWLKPNIVSSMNVTTQRSLVSNVSLLKQKASKHSITGVAIAVATIIIATVLSGYFTTGEIGLEAFAEAQQTNMVLWFLDAMPFIFAFWGQHVSSIISHEAGAMVIDQTNELRKQSFILEQKAAYDATHDSLTGLPNRVLFIDRLQQAVQISRREATTLGVLIIDLDHFKEINDTLGHHIGDRLLKQVGTRLSAVLRESDTFARIGGDEFGTILPNVKSKESIELIANKMKQALSAPFKLDNLALDIRASVGASYYPEHGNDADTLIQTGDVAMYVAKQSNLSFALYAEELNKHNPKRLTIMGELRRALQNDELLLHFQPKINCATNSLQGVEALVRWNHPQHGLIPPDEFIPLAERTGLIDDLTVWVLKRSLHQCSVWHEVSHNLGMAVNISSVCLLNPEFPDILIGLLSSYRLPPNSLSLEITETSMMIDPDRALSILTQLHNQGIRISIDDFGTGYSSLAYLKDLPVSELKIDKSFVTEMLTKEREKAIVKATIQLGRNLGLQVVAEGVETLETAEKLRSLGCDFLQGFLISRPVPADQLTNWAIEKNHFPSPETENLPSGGGID